MFGQNPMRMPDEERSTRARQAAGKRLLSTRRTERAGVNAVRAILEDAGFTVLEVERSVDIGIDAYVGIADNGVFTGDTVGVQIKTGPSYCVGGRYRVPCNRNDSAVWAGSSVPVYGLVHDMGTGHVHWVDLSTWARGLPADATNSFCETPELQVIFDRASAVAWGAIATSNVRRAQQVPLLGLMSPDSASQVGAAYDCFLRGRTDPRPLMLLRHALTALNDVDATWPAISLLAAAVGHRDVMYGGDIQPVPSTLRAALAQSMRWTVEEAAFLIAAPADDMWRRGDLGQSVYVPLNEDPRCDILLEHVVLQTEDENVRWRAAMIRVSRAGDEGLECLLALVKGCPALTRHELYGELRTALADHGSVALL
jgi:hypothetical protein